MDAIDHIAISVKNLSETVSWYQQEFQAKVLYQDDTWAMLQFANIKLAFVIEKQHPPHIAFCKENAGEYGKLSKHRDNTCSTYIKDPSGNIIEIMLPLKD
ncbi:VOC family protein [Facilibium subflavum]|uniref:VOC family protein n=1 Tax=Facilibium subflavum TaxID=2219058 RepID=UPI000E64EA5F|nr:VOC family protein [Facilibium subflavum]